MEKLCNISEATIRQYGQMALCKMRPNGQSRIRRSVGRLSEFQYSMVHAGGWSIVDIGSGRDHPFILHLECLLSIVIY